MLRAALNRFHLTQQSGAQIGWSLVAFSIACLVLAPIFAILYLGLTAQESALVARPLSPEAAPDSLFAVFSNFFSTLRYGTESANTLALIGGVGFWTLLLGASTGWLVASYEFRLRRLLAVLLVLPLAMPAYISAYVYVEVFNFGGPIQTALRMWFDWQRPSDYYFPDLHSLGGAVFILSLALYPYIYIASLGVFSRRSSSLLKAARMLGLGAAASFFKLALPLARPTLFAVLMLVFMECLNDIGVVEYLGVRTLTMGLYDVWINRGDLGGAIQIALWMMAFAFVLIMLERQLRKNRLYASASASLVEGKRLRGKPQACAIIICLLPPLLGFLLPMAVLGNLSISQVGVGLTLDLLKLWTYANHSLALAVSATVLIVGGGLMLSYAQRIAPSAVLHYFSHLSVMGYALPGVVLGLGIILLLSQTTSGVFVTGYKVLLFAYFVRFLALPFGMITGSLHAIAPQLDWAARSLGLKVSEVFGRIHLPLIRPAIWGAFVFVFVEVMRELPLTLITRSFDFDTLATHIYTMASLGLIEDIALAAFFLGLIGLLPAYLWSRALVWRTRATFLPKIGLEATPGIEPR